ncbi:hypothetical protein D3C74_137510 [compost metagenome]
MDHDEIRKMEEVRKAAQSLFDTMFSDSEYRLVVSPCRKDGSHDFGKYASIVDPKWGMPSPTSNIHTIPCERS